MVNKRRPEPSTSGKVIRRKRSTSSCCNSVWSSLPLPESAARRRARPSAPARPQRRCRSRGERCRGARPATRGIGLAERVGHDVLGQRVDRRGNGVGGVGLIRPVAAEDVERPAAEQERAGVAVELGPSPDSCGKLIEGIAEERVAAFSDGLGA